MLKKVFELQLKHKTRGDWASTVLDDLKELQLSKPFEEIKENRYASKYLTDKQKSKGKEIVYSEIKMAEYLQPNSPLTIDQKQRMFALKN